MSQAGILDVESSNPQIPTSFVTNSGTAVPIGNTIEFLGNSLQGVSSSGSGNTITYTVANATTASKGVASFDPVDFTVVNGNVTFAGSGIGQTITGDSGGSLSPVAGNWNLVGAGSVTTSGSGNTLTTQLTGLTNHSLLVGAGTTTIGKLAVGTNGQVVIGATGSNPAFATLTSSDSSISFTTGANTLSLQVGTNIGKTITGDSGGALSPTAGNWSLLGSGSITSSGSGSTLTTQLTGLTNHALLVGAGSTTITKVGPTATAGQVLQSAGSSADPAFSTATFPSTATGTGTLLRADGTNWAATTSTYPNTNAVSTLLYASSANVMGALATANSGVLITSAGGVPSISSTLPSAVQTNITQAGAVTLTSVNFGGSILSTYTEGTWTPTIIGASVAGTTTYSTQSGFYIKIGSLVTVWAYIAITGASGTGNAVISSLPFTVKNQSTYAPPGTLILDGSGWPFPVGRTSIMVYGDQGGTTAELYAVGTGTAGAHIQMANAAATIQMTLTYQA